MESHISIQFVGVSIFRYVLKGRILNRNTDALRVTVTPHVAAMSRGREISQCFLANLDLVDAGQPPANLVDWDKLY